MADKTRKRPETAHPREIPADELMNTALALAAQSLREHAAVLAIRSPRGNGALSLREHARAMDVLLDARTR